MNISSLIEMKERQWRKFLLELSMDRIQIIMDKFTTRWSQEKHIKILKERKLLRIKECRILLNRRKSKWRKNDQIDIEV